MLAIVVSLPKQMIIRLETNDPTHTFAYQGMSPTQTPALSVDLIMGYNSTEGKWREITWTIKEDGKVRTLLEQEYRKYRQPCPSQTSLELGDSKTSFETLPNYIKPMKTIGADTYKYRTNISLSQTVFSYSVKSAA